MGKFKNTKKKMNKKKKKKKKRAKIEKKIIKLLKPKETRKFKLLHIKNFDNKRKYFFRCFEKKN